ncbi:acid phosphatase [Sphingomonas aliaeris]|uniref:Acid phosphatase n=1 Tax=Sphingomonas aliaeris TaxID=2759526 RepID=A0A974NX42_9SPHN|nr:HAD family acid phosphatase [Sphingomonas aliaeris]QQV78511.1 acid phosphatase [Sphingomonas aliaeris]
MSRTAILTAALALACGSTASARTAAQAAPIAVPDLPRPSPGIPAPAPMQYLYGSGEAAANTRAIWRGLVDYVRANRRNPRSVVLADGASLDAPRWSDCGKRPQAVIFDVDETVLLNAGFEYDAAMGAPYSDKRWQEWEYHGTNKPVATPGAVAALNQLRAIGVRVIFNSNRLTAFADRSKIAIEQAGLGTADYQSDPTRWADQTLYLAEGTGEDQKKKDARRAAVAAHYCVVAMGGDQLGDFSDLFNTGRKPQDRRALADLPGIADLWGAGWFVFPNPVYGSALKGTAQDVFPVSVRWPDTPADTAQEKK